jgi:3-oxoacyl-[acyl-carrier protein] reductase
MTRPGLSPSSPAAAEPGVGTLRSKVAIVTGAPRSIGRAIAESLAAEGARLVVHYRSRREEALATVAALPSGNADAIAVGGDLGDSSAVSALFDQARAQFGGVDIVVANAGATAPLLPVAAISDEVFESLLIANTRATFYVLREAARAVRDGGRIINISSSSVRFPAAGFAAYASSKAAAVTTIGILATELGFRGITANTVMAGPIAAGFLDTDGDLAKGAPSGVMEALAAAAPTGRMGLPSDIGPIVAFLATPEAGWINGQTILANNGAAV